MHEFGESWPEHVPIFPLPSTVLFPGALVPLHIFEPRYKQMIADVLAGERVLGIGLLRPGWEMRQQAFPAVYPMLGVGSVVWHESMEGGRYNIIVEGIARARIERYRRLRPYRIARLRWQPEKDSTYHQADQERRVLLSFVRMLSEEAMPMDVLVDDCSMEEMSLRELVDHVASRIEVDAHDKQRILGETVLAYRVQRLSIVLQRLVWRQHPMRRVSPSLFDPDYN